MLLYELHNLGMMLPNEDEVEEDKEEEGEVDEIPHQRDLRAKMRTVHGM